MTEYTPKHGDPIYTTNIANQVIEVGYKGIESPKFILKTGEKVSVQTLIQYASSCIEPNIICQNIINGTCNSPREEHKCPYKEDVLDDKTLCRCCHSCTTDCADDI